MFFDKRFKSTLLTSVSMGAVLIGTNALANPEGANIVTGDVAINGLGTDHVIIQNDSNRSVVNWDKFSIGAGETTTINQVTNDAAILNRVVSDNVSEIYGTLESNGQVFLINQSGIVIGASGIVDTNGLIASTLDVSNSDFLGAGDMIFSQGIEKAGGIEVHGKIKSVSGGDIFLLSREITIGTTAEISSNGGYVGLGAGEEILLRPTDTGEGRISIRAGKGKIVNKGMIEGAAAELKAAGGNEYALAINNTGVVRATGYSKKGGKIRLGGGGKVRNTGKLVTRKKVIVRSKTKIENSGQIKAGDGNKGGEIIFEAPEIEVKTDSILDVAGALGGGRIFVGGGYQGTGADSQGNAVDITDNAIKVTVDDGAVLTASATQSGDAGEIVIWADGETIFAGDISARASGESGDGGQVEISGKEILTYRGTVDASSVNGKAGHLLLDPETITVISTGAAAAGEILDDDIESVLEGGTNVTIKTSTPEVINAGGAGLVTGGAADGDVIFSAGVRIQWVDGIDGTTNQDTTFRVEATRDIIAADDVLIQHSEIGTGAAAVAGDLGPPLVVATADNVINGQGGITFLAGGNIEIGSAAAATGNVAIGSEFGTTLMVAGDTDFDSTVAAIDTEAAGNVTVTGSTDGSFSAQIGYVVNAARANNTGFDKIGINGTATAGDVADNGNIIVAAQGDVTLTGGDVEQAFAQIGHGGEAAGNSVGSIINSHITVQASNIVLEHAAKESDTESSEGTYAQIGHGSLLKNDSAADAAQVQGAISGNITVDATANLDINTTFTISNDDPDKRDYVLSQIGHGGHIYYKGATLSGANSKEASFGNIAGGIDVNVTGNLTLGAAAAPGANDDPYAIQSKIGHGGFASLALDDTNINASADNSFDVEHGSIIGTDVAANRASSETGYSHTNITVDAAQIKLIAIDNAENSATPVSNTQQSQIGHGTTSVFSRDDNAISTGVARDVTITDNRIAGNVTVTDTVADAVGVTLESSIAAGNIAITKDVMITRIGHASTVSVESLDGDAVAATGAVENFNGGNVTIRQAHILGADIKVDTKTNGGANDDIILKTSIAAGLGAVEDNTAVAQIGHGGDVFVSTGNGGASAIADKNSADGGDITLIRGTVWDGGLVHDADGHADGAGGFVGELTDSLAITNTTNITIHSSNEIIIDSDTVSSALAAADRNNSESSIGHGFKQRLVTGNGGTSTGEGAAGGAGGDILVYQGVDVREYGIDITDVAFDGRFDDYAYGLRGDITVSATNSAGNAISITSTDTSAVAGTNFNTDLSTLGHGDVLEAATGKGGNGSTGRDQEGDDVAVDGTGQVSVAGGRGGHIDVQLGRHTGIDQYGTTGGSDMVSDDRVASNAADIGDTRAQTLNEGLAERRQGLSLIEGDIFVNVFGGTVDVEGSITNAVAASNNAISESVIGHAHRFTADAGDGGDAGSGNFHSQSQTVYGSELTGEEFLNYASSTGSNRGGNGGDVRLTYGDITDRTILDRVDTDDTKLNGNIIDEIPEIYHDTDADHSGTTNITFNVATGYSQASNVLIDGSSDIYMYLHDEDAGGTAQANPDSLKVISTIGAGTAEGNGSALSNVGHHIRMIAEGGKGGAGGSSNTEFDQDGNSLSVNPATGQTDSQDADLATVGNQDGIDETALQAGSVFIQPNSSGGRGGDVFAVTNNITGNIVVNAARRVTVQSGDGHGGDTIVNASIGHTTDIFSATQAGGAAGSLIEDAGMANDGGIINVGGAQISGGDHSANSVGDETPSFVHILIDGNQDDQFNLENIGGADSTVGEDGIAVTESDRENRTGSTFASIANTVTGLGTLTTTDADPNTGIYTGAADAVIFHDEEGDPQFIKNDNDEFVLNNEANNTAHAHETYNLDRYGRVVAAYDGTQTQTDNAFFAVSDTAGNTLGGAGSISLEVFVDMDQDGDIDLVDFDRDGRLDIVDVDRDGKMDIIDGRANYVGSTTVNQISGLGVLDYVAVTGKNFNQTTASSTGEAWTNHNELRSTDLLSDYNGGTDSDFTAYVSDFATANGGRGGDAYSQVGTSSGDISVSTGDNDDGKADTLIVKTTAPDATNGNGPNDYLRAVIGHNAVQISDAGGDYSAYRVGREGLIMETEVHVAADGGAAGDFAINGNGGRGGNAAVVQGVARDHSGIVDEVNVVNTEVDHLVGDIFINTPNTIDNSNSSDSARISITGDVGANSPDNHNLVSQIGHSSLALAGAGNGAIGASAPGGEDGSSQTELADGGDGGDAYITQNHIKGDITVMTGGDDLEGPKDFSIVMSATDADPTGKDLIIAQIGHGRQAKVLAGDGGVGDDGQFRGNGGAGGNASLDQKDILDSVIKIDLVDTATGYDGNGLQMLSKSVSGTDDIFRVQVGHGDLGFAQAGNGGAGTKTWNVNEQRNQTANGGTGGDAIVNQAGYNHDIILDIGSNEAGGEALQVLSSAAATTNGANDHLLAAIGHGGMAEAIGGDGADGGLNGTTTGIPTEVDPNLRDGDYFDSSNTSGLASGNGDSIGVIDQGNHIVLGTTRRGGDAGDGVVNLNVGGTGRTIDDRAGTDISNDYGTNDLDGADITITVNDMFDAGSAAVAGNDGVLIQTTLGPGSNQDSALYVNTAIVGHHGFAEGTGGTGGNGIQTAKTATISDGDGGDGGSGIASIAEVRGDVSIDNNIDTSGVSTDGINNSNTNKDTNITIETINGTTADAADHRGDARVGHMSQAQATGGDGGESAREAGNIPSFPATISTQGGDGGDALTFQGQQEGNITLTAENSVIVSARDTTTGAGALVAAVGHRVFAETKAGQGNYGGTYKEDATGTAEDVAVTLTFTATNDGTTKTYTRRTDGTDNYLCLGDTCYLESAGVDSETGVPNGSIVDGTSFTNVTRTSTAASVYFTYEALREFHHRRTSGATDAAAFAALSEFEQKLVAPVTDYFENKQGELEIFLDRLVGNSLSVIQHNERDDDAIGGGDYSIPTLVDGSGHINGADDGEIETLSAILAASGHGGNAVVTQGSAGLSGFTDKLAASGDILITANDFDTSDAKRGITVEGVGGSTGASFQLGHVGHQSEAHQLTAGDGKDVNGRNGGANGIGGDGGDAVVDQYALNGGVDLVSNHKILVSARDTAASGHETRAWVGHRLTIGSDYTAYRAADSVVSGKGGSEQSVPYADGHNGNGGDVFIYQRGVISGTERTVSTATTTAKYDTEISLAALQDAVDHNSITVEAQAVAAPAPDVETHIGHDFLIHAVKAGDAGRQAATSIPEGASEGLLEGNGGDIFIAQTDLGADIDIVGRDEVLINAVTSAAGGNHAHLMIGHERTIGNSAESGDELDGGITDNPRTGKIIAGFGGDSHIEDVNGTAMASRVAAAQGIIEDGDSGRIEIALGKLTDSLETTDDTRLVTITSITEDVDILSNAALGKAILEIGNQQQVIAETQSAAEYTATPHDQTAGDAGGIFINRATIDGDILIQAIDADRLNSAKPADGKQVVIDSTSASGSKAITQIGHETQFDVKTSTPVTARAAFGEDRNFLHETNLSAYVGLVDAGTGAAGEATLRDAQNAVEDMRDVVRALELASENADRFPADDGVSEIAGATADRGEIFALLTNARTALSNAEADLISIGHGNNDPSEAGAINAVMGHAQELITAATDFQTILSANIVPEAGDQIADFAEGGDIVYGSLGTLALDGNNGLNSHTSSIAGVASNAHVSSLSIQHAPSLTAVGFTVADTGIVEGNIEILSGRDSSLSGVNLKSASSVIGNDSIKADNFGGTGFTAADDLDDSVVIITANADSRSLTEIGHRRIMTNTTDVGGGDSNGDTHDGGIAGDAGSIVTKNITRGDISVQAEEVVINTKGGAGEAEVHFLHSSHTKNQTGWSDLEALLGNGGDVYNTTVVSGGVHINAEQIASALNEQDRMLLATGSANTFIHMGHQAEDTNESQSDQNDKGSNKGDSQTNLGSNRGGKVVSSQTVTGNSDDDLVIITLDAAGDGNQSDLILETGGDKGSDIRLGNGEDGTMKGIYQDGYSGANNSDDGDEVLLTQFVSGDIKISNVEDLVINVMGTGDQSIYIGHDAEQFGQSGQVNNAPDILQYGERVTVTQTVKGNVNVDTTSSYTAILGATAGELHVGHEATQSGFSADDSADPSDYQAGNAASLAGVNDSFARPDVMATQTIEAGISIVTGEITLENQGAGDRIHFGHEAFHKAAVDGDLKDANGRSTGHVVASSKINSDGSDILFNAKGSSVQNDTVVTPVNGTQGDIQLNAIDAAEIQVGHRSTSTMGDKTSSKAPEGQFNAEQIIGSSTLDANGNEVADTSQGVIEFRAAQDIIIASATGETQVGHYIVEEGNKASTDDPLDVDGNAATGLAQGDSELRQIVGSDILFGNNQNQGSGGVGINGAGNNIIVITDTGRSLIGHQSPASNEWQTEGTRSVTVQLLDGDITVEAGTDAGLDAPNGTVLTTAAAAIADESGLGDDLLIKSGGGTARIGHNMAGFTEGSLNETQRSAGDIWVRAGGDMHILGGAVGHEHYDFMSSSVSETNSTPASTIRDRIRGNTVIAAGQNSSAHDSILTPDVLKIDGANKITTVNSGYGGIGDKDVDGELRFFLPAQENLTISLGKGVIFNDSLSNSDLVPERVTNPNNVFENEAGLNHEHLFTLASFGADYLDSIIGDGNFAFYFEVPAVKFTPYEFTPYFTRGSNDSSFNVRYLNENGTSAGGSINTDGLSDDYIGTSSYDIACEEASQGSGSTDEGGGCTEVGEQYDGIIPGYGSNGEWSGSAGGNANISIPQFEDEDALGNNEQVFGFTVYNEPVITTNTIAVERKSEKYFNIKTVTRRLRNADGRVITRNTSSGSNHMNGFGRTVTNPSPLNVLNSPITTSTAGAGVNGFDVSSNAAFSTTTHQFFTGYMAGNDYQVTAVENTIGTYVDETGIDTYVKQHAGAMSFASSYQVFEEKMVK